MRRGANDYKGISYDPEWTLRKGIENAHAMNPDPEAGMTFLSDKGEAQKLTFREVHAEARRRGLWLLKLGLNKGDACAFIIPDPYDFVLTFLGATYVGVVPVPLYPPLGFGKLDAFIRDTARTLNTAKVKMLVTAKKVQPILWSLVDKVDTMGDVVIVESFEGDPVGAPEPEDVTPDDVCFLQFTSGSTAAPKGVVVTHRSLGANGYAIMNWGLEVDIATDVACMWLPLYHDMGLIGFVISPLTVGLQTVFMPTLRFIKRPSSWMQMMSDHKGTVTFAPNFAYGLAVKRTKAEKVPALDLSSVRLLGAGAEPNNPETLQGFIDHFAPAGLKPEAMLPVYGMAEATLAMTFGNLDEPFQVDTVDAEVYADTKRAEPVDVDAAANSDKTILEFVSCGYVWPNHGIKIIDHDGASLPDRHVGEVVFSGPSVAAGYFENPEATAAVFKDDGIRTGDLGYLAEGQLFITGRKKDLIIINGRNYDPQSIEWVAHEVDGCRKGNVIAFSRPGESGEELVIASETKLTEGHDALKKAIASAVRHEFSLNPADIVLTGPGTLPKTTSGKLQRAKAKMQYLNGNLGGDGVRTAGDKGQSIILAKHVAKSTVSRVKHALKKRGAGLFKKGDDS